MPSLDFTTLDVFTSTKFRGNPLAVVTIPVELKSTLTQAHRQSIATEFNLSETVFLHEPADHSSTTREVNIHTIEKELPFAGHPIIGTTFYLLQHLGLGHVDTLQLKAGRFGISKQAAEGHVTADIAHDVHLHGQTLRSISESDKANAQIINAALSDDAAIRDAELDAPVFSVVRGMTFVLVELPSLEHLAKVTDSKRLYVEKLRGLLDEGPWEETFMSRYYYVAQGTGSGGGKRVEKYRTRMVELGAEDPATGSAASALTSYLALKGSDEKVAYEITQGVEMGRQSEIAVDIEMGTGADEAWKIKTLKLGGTSVVVMKGTIEV